MNILIDRLPTKVEIGGAEYEINSDFRISILFEMMMQDDEIPDKEKGLLALNMYYPVIPDDISEAIQKMLWFYSCGKEVDKKGKDEDEDEEQYDYDENDNMTYSFEYDAEYIYAAFLEQYGVDLQDKDLHWWKFKAMFKSLDEECKFMKIIGYRTIKLTSKMPKEQRSFYQKMKRIFALPMSKTEQDKYDAITNALMNGGDIENLLNE